MLLLLLIFSDYLLLTFTLNCINLYLNMTRLHQIYMNIWNQHLGVNQIPVGAQLLCKPVPWKVWALQVSSYFLLYSSYISIPVGKISCKFQCNHCHLVAAVYMFIRTETSVRATRKISLTNLFINSFVIHEWNQTLSQRNKVQECNNIPFHKKMQICCGIVTELQYIQVSGIRCLIILHI